MPLPTPRGLPFVRAELCVLWLAWLAGWKWPSLVSQKKLQSSPDRQAYNELPASQERRSQCRPGRAPHREGQLRPPHRGPAATAGAVAPGCLRKGDKSDTTPQSLG